MDTDYLRELAEEGAAIHTETQPEREVCDGLLWALDELAALRKDAERYRWLRKVGTVKGVIDWNALGSEYHDLPAMDAAIDALAAVG